MVADFGITLLEAEGRIASTLGSWDLLERESELAIGHELPQYWARWIYYGPGVQWWLVNESELDPQPWP